MQILTSGSRPTVAIEHSGSMGDFLDEVRGHRDQVAALLRTCGSLLVRGTPIGNADEFGAFSRALYPTGAAYKEKATPRSRVGDGVFSSTDLPAAQVIRQHNENSYTMTFPGKLVFGCLGAPTSGGATPTCDVSEVWRSIDPSLRDRFTKEGWLLRRSFSEHLSISWRDAYGVETLDELEEYCASNRIRLRVTEGRVTTEQRRSACIDPSGDRPRWFNHVAFWSRWSLEPDVREALVDEFDDALPFDTAFGSGEQLDQSIVQHLNDCFEQHTVRQDWARGDVLVVDNLLASHGRESFGGPRRIAVTMHDEVRLVDCNPSLSPGLM